jgi:hypothetical protein
MISVSKLILVCRAANVAADVHSSRSLRAAYAANDFYRVRPENPSMPAAIGRPTDAKSCTMTPCIGSTTVSHGARWIMRRIAA